MPYFDITGATTNTVSPERIIIDDRTLSRMTTSRGLVPPFRMREVTIHSRNRAAKTNISLCFTEGTSFPISGFPRCLHDSMSDNPSSPGRPKLKAMGSIRWASRSGSQRQRRFDWKPPNLPTPMEADDVIARYSDVSHLLGSATSLPLFTDHVHELGPSPPAPRKVRELVPHYSFESFDAFSLPADSKATTLGVDDKSVIHELPTIEVRHELPAVEAVYELASTETQTTTPRFWMADEDWADTAPRDAGSMYMSLACGDRVKVLEMPTDGLNGSVWRVLRPSDGRVGWVPSHCLRPLEDVVPRRQQFDASPIDGVFW